MSYISETKSYRLVWDLLSLLVLNLLFLLVSVLLCELMLLCELLLVFGCYPSFQKRQDMMFGTLIEYVRHSTISLGVYVGKVKGDL